jgi:ADP-ribosyl-[dinitrogen reductase] hydrolase
MFRKRHDAFVRAKRQARKPVKTLPTIQRFRGSLLGLAAGDALGASIEGMPPGSFRSISTMLGGGPHELRPGEWTDDTAMALCLAASLVETRGFDPTDQMSRYVRWLREGYMSSTGEAFDVGMTVSEALHRFTHTNEPFSGPTHQWSAGNGSLMRLAPVPLFYWRDADEAVRRAAESSMTTHGAAEAVDACRYLARLITMALWGASKYEILSDTAWNDGSLAPEIARVAEGSFKAHNPPKIRGTGYVVHCLEAALWAFHRGRTFREGCLLAVNLGDDADTTGAVYGQLAGAFFGEREIPVRWRAKLAKRTLIEDLADWLFEASFDSKCTPAATAGYPL